MCFYLIIFPIQSSFSSTDPEVFCLPSLCAEASHYSLCRYTLFHSLFSLPTSEKPRLYSSLSFPTVQVSHHYTQHFNSLFLISISMVLQNRLPQPQTLIYSLNLNLKCIFLPFQATWLRMARISTVPTERLFYLFLLVNASQPMCGTQLVG